MSTELVRNVSDTARWVATYRARESARKDALFDDPLAARLASERGHAIADAASKHSEWAIITRTKLIDDLVLETARGGSERLLDLAAGFDTRPYRLALPPTFRWIEADLPALVAEKEELLRGETPHCVLERHAVDLSDTTARTRFLAESTAGASNVTVMTEGLVMYLDESVVASLARDFLATPAISAWILDFNSPRIRAEMMDQMAKTLNNAPLRFAPENGVAFWEALGWKPRVVKSLFHEAARLKRLPLWMRPFALLPQPDVRSLGDERWTGVVRFERA
ncbi:MAG TPA: class I SAM-dependent methyltransferase [Polyangiaceae bacterium]|nr:class I SAM-dependent methyltransferase [Polyangiaceae bacterium]